jgi:hypothetical protein
LEEKKRFDNWYDPIILFFYLSIFASIVIYSVIVGTIYGFFVKEEKTGCKN